MASPRAILAATKAVPGTAQPTPPPQGGQWYGQVSPAVRDQDTSNGYASAYGPFLPRPPQDFTAGAFGPFSPILPVPVDTPEDDGRAVPRREQYEVGWNLPTGQPGTEGIKLATFQTLRSIADLYSVARSCIQLRKNEIKGIGWDIVPTPDAAKAMRGDKKAMREFGERRGKAMRFFHRPDPDYFTWSSWIGDAMEQMLVFDALSIFLQPKRARGLGKGLLGSDLDSFSLIDGETIRPLYDLNGATPRPPAPGYQQYLYGVPRTDLTSVITGRDIEQSGVGESAWKKFRGDQLLYLPVEKRRWTPYGFPPVERALLPIMAGLQKQGYALDFFREGTVPAVYISPGDATMTPNQIRELQDALNAIAGDPAFHHKIIVLPPGSKTEPQRPAALADQFDEVVMNWVCMSFDVSPMELGIAPKVSTTMSPGASNQMAKMSQGSQERKATKPTLEYIGAICDFVLQEVCHQDDMRFLFEGLEEEEDEATKTTTLVTQIGAGLLSIDEGRGEIGKQPWGLPETSDPGWASATGFLPLGQMNTQGQPQAGFAQPDAAHPAGAPPGQPGAPQQVAGAPQRAALPAGQAKPQTGPGRATAAQAPARGQSPGHDAAVAAHGTGSGRGGGQRSASGADKSAEAERIEAAMLGDDPDVFKHDAAHTVATGIVSAAAAQVAAGKFPADPDFIPGTLVQGLLGHPQPHPASKAALAELDALARHLRKGRAVGTWEPRHLSGEILDEIAEDLDKGFTVDEATSMAAGSFVGKVGPEGYVHGWVCVRPPCGEKPARLRAADLTVRSDGGVVHKPSGWAVGHVARSEAGGWTANHSDGSRTVHGARPDAVKAIARHHNSGSTSRPATAKPAPQHEHEHEHEPATSSTPANRMSKDELIHHLENYHGGGPAIGRRIGSKNPPKKDLLTRHEEMHKPPSERISRTLGGVGVSHSHENPAAPPTPAGGVNLAEKRRLTTMWTKAFRYSNRTQGTLRDAQFTNELHRLLKTGKPPATMTPGARDAHDFMKLIEDDATAQRTPLYRGLTLPSAEIRRMFKAGGTVDLPIASWGKSEDTAKAFGGEGGVVIVAAPGAKGLDLSPIEEGGGSELEYRAKLQEVVTGGRFPVQSVSQKNGMTYVQLGPQGDFSAH